MSHHIGPVIAASGRLGLGYADRLTRGIKDEQYARFAPAGNSVIESNHPAFILGHLSLYPERIVAALGGDAAEVTPPANYESLFSFQAKCQHDPERRIYPPLEEVLEVMKRGYQQAVAALESADDQLLLQENENERMRERFATQGAMFAFYVGGHFMMHMGQLSAWRRMMGLGAA